MAASGTNFLNPLTAGVKAGSTIGGLFGGLFGPNPADPYKKAGKQYQQYAGQAAGYQMPFYQAGTSSIPTYQDWLKSMSDPAAFINNLTNQYSTSPQEQYAQDQAMRAGTNAASASGLIGSTPYQLQAQENAANIANQYQNQWLQNVLGINTMYGQGLEGLVGRGQMSANQLTSIYQDLARQMAEMQYAQEYAKQKQQSDMWSDLGGLAGGAASLFF